MSPSGTIVEMRDVFVAFPGAAGAVMALRGADLTVARGERLVVQGPNGSGKSTLLQVITGEQPVVTGTVDVGGAALHQLSAAERRRWRSRNVGFLDQHARRNLLSEASVLDNVALQLRLIGTAAATARSTAEAMLEELGLAGLTRRAVADLSGGEAQRMSICAAVAHRPWLVLADEPTGELDEDSARVVHEMLSGIAAQGASVILVSHDVRSLEFADRAVRIRDGRVAEQWRPGFAVEQLPDSRGWVRVPPELLESRPSGAGLRTSRQSDGLLLTPGSVGLSPRPASPGRASGSAVRDVGLFPPPQPAARRQVPSHPAGAEPLVALRDVSAAYPGVPVFQGVQLEVGYGELVPVTGRSGAGKSTLLSLVVGLLEPVAGTVRVGSVGAPDAGWAGRTPAERAELRRHWLAYSPQHPHFVEGLTLAENLELTLVTRGSVSAGQDLAETADRLGLTALLGQPVHQLSGGERQRASLARCLVSGGPLLVLDEPTSQQDEASAKRVADVLAEEVAAGRTVLAATHDALLIGLGRRRVDLDRHSSDGIHSE